MSPKKQKNGRGGAPARNPQTLLAIIALAVGIGALLTWNQAGPGVLTQRGVAAGKRAGIVAGHLGSDSGAVCPDGLTEAQVNMAIAQRVVDRLRRAGAEADLLQEFDPRLAGYRADAFVSIHADSCDVKLNGFKVARLERSAVPEVDDRLAACLWTRYEQATGLPRHTSTITYDMRDYHAFREVAAETPAVIIETGFLGGDRQLIEKQPDRAARGIADAVLCFWEQ